VNPPKELVIGITSYHLTFEGYGSGSASHQGIRSTEKTVSLSFCPKKRGRNAGFGPSGDKKVTLLQSAFLEFNVTP
jgi:hypothetical protein